jgi:hypothetical protein
MEICWIYAWASFTFMTIVGRAVSFPSMASIFIFSALLTKFSRGRGWRVVSLAGMHVLGYTCAAMFLLCDFYDLSLAGLETAWITMVNTASRTPPEWLHLVLTLLWVGLLWFGGAAYAKRERNYATLCNRFDIGLAAFFVLLLTKLALRVKGGVNTDDFGSSMLIYPYLLLAITAIGAARVGHEGSRHFLPGYGGLGIFMSGVSLVLLAGSSLVLFLIPCLTQVAEVGQRVIKVTAIWILPVVTGVIRFMFVGGKIRPDPPSGSSPKGSEGSGILLIAGWWFELLEKIIRWGLEVMVVTFLILLIGILLYLVLKWLLSRTTLNPSTTVSRRISLSWFARLRIILSAYWEALKNLTRGYSKAAELYSILSEWGRRSGVPRFATNTPHEFGARLASQFPALKAEIGSIISAFNLEVYGKMTLTREQFTRALAAWRAVRSPAHWPRRLKTRFINRKLSER